MCVLGDPARFHSCPSSPSLASSLSPRSIQGKTRKTSVEKPDDEKGESVEHLCVFSCADTCEWLQISTEECLFYSSSEFLHAVSLRGLRAPWERHFEVGADVSQMPSGSGASSVTFLLLSPPLFAVQPADRIFLSVLRGGISWLFDADALCCRVL